MITKFKITQLPVRATLTINGGSLIINQEYTIAEQSTMVVSSLSVGSPYDAFKFKIGSDTNIWSAEKTAKINALVEIGIPDNPSYIFSVEKNQATNIDGIILPDNKTDRIKIISLPSVSYGDLYINGTVIFPGQIILLYEFINLIFNSNYTGSLPNPSHNVVVQYGNPENYSLDADWTFISSANLDVEIITETIITGILN